MKNAIRSFLELITEKRLTTVAGAWVFFFLTSVIPIMFLLITAFGVFGVNLSLEIVSRLPEEFRTAGETIVFTAENASKSATILFVFTVIFSSSALINQMSKDGDFIYGAKNKNKRGLLRRLWAIAAMLLTFIVFLVAAFLTAFGGALFSSVNFSGARQTLSTFLFFFFVIGKSCSRELMVILKYTCKIARLLQVVLRAVIQHNSLSLLLVENFKERRKFEGVEPLSLPLIILLLA